MKTISLFVLTFIVSVMNAQITLDHTYITSSGMSSCILSNNNIMYYTYPDTVLNQIKLYNEDHSLFKTITIPHIDNCYGMNYMFVDDMLFNNDDNIELFIMYGIYTLTNSYSFTAYIIDEDSKIIKDFGIYNYRILEPKLLSTGIISKLIIRSISNDTKTFVDNVYSLPNKTVIPNILKSTSISIPTPYPNPATIYINLPYQLELYQTTKLQIYNISGVLIDQKTIDYNFNNILLDIQTYSTGTYYYKYNDIIKQFIVH